MLSGQAAWTEAASSDRLVLHVAGPQLTESFRLEGVGKPLAIPTVIAELCRMKSYSPLQQFLTSPQSIYDPGWLPYRIASFVVGKPLWWALQQLSIVGSDDALGSEGERERWKKVKGDYVVVGLLERAAEAVQAKQEEEAGLSLADSLYSFDGFKRQFSRVALDGVTLSDLDLRVLLRFLERDKHAIVRQGDVIKFVQGATSAEITAIDVGVLELKTAVGNLDAAIERLHVQIDDRTEKASAALRQKRKEVALSHIRARKQFEDLLKKRLASLDTLHSTLIRVEASAGDVEIMKTYESSTATLRAILAHPSLQRDKIDETMDAMASANADAKDIDDAIRMGVDMAQADANIDDADLEAELAALVEDVQAEKTAETKVKEEEELQRRLSNKELGAPAHIPEVPETQQEANVSREAA